MHDCATRSYDADAMAFAGAPDDMGMIVVGDEEGPDLPPPYMPWAPAGAAVRDRIRSEQLRQFGSREHRACFLQEYASCLGQFDPAADPVEELGAMTPFERGDGGGEQDL